MKGLLAFEDVVGRPQETEDEYISCIGAIHIGVNIQPISIIYYPTNICEQSDRHFILLLAYPLHPTHQLAKPCWWLFSSLLDQ